MNIEAISPTTLRIAIAAIGLLVVVAIYFFGRPRKPGQGRRTLLPRRADTRVEPVIGDGVDDAAATAGMEPEQGVLDVARAHASDDLDASGARERRPGAPPQPAVGRRPADAPVDRIVSLFVIARGDELFRGTDIVVAAEKTGLRFGAMNIFHRLAEGRPNAGPVFSMANMVKPGYFDLGHVGELATPGVTFFITLPGPLAALDAWDTMLPAAQRAAELLDGELLDEDRNTLGRQRVAGLRDELRAWDRQHEGEPVRFPGWR